MVAPCHEATFAGWHVAWGGLWRRVGVSVVGALALAWLRANSARSPTRRAKYTSGILGEAPCVGRKLGKASASVCAVSVMHLQRDATQTDRLASPQLPL